MGKTLPNPTHHAAESLSAFFVGLLYFLAQWMWQMVNAKVGAGLPVAYILFLATAISGAFSFHALLMYGDWPPTRMRIVNALLFFPFLLIGLFSYERAKLGMIAIDPKFLGTNWYERQDFIVFSSVLIGVLPLPISYALKSLVKPDPTSDHRIDA